MILCGFKIEIYKNKNDNDIHPYAYFNVTHMNYRELMNKNLKLRHNYVNECEKSYNEIYYVYLTLKIHNYNDNKYFKLYQKSCVLFDKLLLDGKEHLNINKYLTCRHIALDNKITINMETLDKKTNFTIEKLKFIIDRVESLKNELQIMWKSIFYKIMRKKFCNDIIDIIWKYI